MIKGNVVKFPHKKDLYVVAEAHGDFLKPDRYILLPFSGANCSIHLSKAHPFQLYDEDGNPTGPCPNSNIDALEFVSECISRYFTDKLKAMAGL